MLRALQILYELRQDKGAKRQPTFETDLIDLDRIMEGKHPYRLSAHQIEELMNIPNFSHGASGKGAVLPNQEYLYRISTITRLLSYTTGWHSASPRKEDLPWVAFRFFEAEMSRTKRWLPLAQYAGGRFSSPRGFSFWSSQELPLGPLSLLLENAHRVGVPNDWLDEVCVLMRCRTNHLKSENLSHIPTVVDGFDSHIFHPTKEAERPTCGVAINLKLSSSLSTGRDEYVLGPIQTDAIEVFPVQIPGDSTPQIDSFSMVLLGLLETYYAGM